MKIHKNKKVSGNNMLDKLFEIIFSVPEKGKAIFKVRFGLLILIMLKS